MAQSGKKVLWTGLALLAAVGAGYMIGHLPPHPAAETARTTAPQKERKVLYWYDPMAPNQHFDKPGKSPFMDMDLVPMYDDAQAIQGAVTIDPRTVQNLGVRTAKVELGNFSRRLDTVGYVKPDEHNIQVVQSRTAGWVERLYVKAANDPVKQGQLLLELYSPDLLAAKEEYLLARQNRHGSDSDALVRASRERLALLGLSEVQISRLEASGKADRRTAFYAPANGIVAELGVRRGAQVSPGMNLFSLVDLSTVWVTAEIPENQGSWVREGATAEIRVEAYPGKRYQGRVEYIYPQVAETTRTIQIRIRLSNADGLLKPGMFANVSLADEEKRNVLVVPSEAIISTGRRNVVIVSDGDGKFHPAAVQLGSESSGRTEILDGLSAGQTIVLSGQFLIDSESNLKTALDRLKEPEPSGQGQQQPNQVNTTADGSQKSVLQIHKGRGTVTDVDLKAGSVTLSHEPVQSLGWPAMTMDFPVADPSTLKGIKPGDVVNFELKEARKGEYVITRMTPLGNGAK